jgi:hypothetical protein
MRSLSPDWGPCYSCFEPTTFFGLLALPLRCWLVQCRLPGVHTLESFLFTLDGDACMRPACLHGQPTWEYQESLSGPLCSSVALRYDVAFSWSIDPFLRRTIVTLGVDVLYTVARYSHCSAGAGFAVVMQPCPLPSSSNAAHTNHRLITHAASPAKVHPVGMAHWAQPLWHSCCDAQRIC